MYGYNAGQPMAIPIYTVLPYCVIHSTTVLCDIIMVGVQIRPMSRVITNITRDNKIAIYRKGI